MVNLLLIWLTTVTAFTLLFLMFKGLFALLDSLTRKFKYGGVIYDILIIVIFSSLLTLVLYFGSKGA